MDKKIDQLDSLPALTGNESFPVELSGNNNKMTVDTLFNGNPSQIKIAFGVTAVDNTADMNKPISGPQQAALDGKLNLTDLVSNAVITPAFGAISASSNEGQSGDVVIQVATSEGYNMDGVKMQVQYMNPATDTVWTNGSVASFVNGQLSYTFHVTGLKLSTAYTARIVMTDINNPSLNLISSVTQFTTLDTYGTHSYSFDIVGVDFIPANVVSDNGSLFNSTATALGNPTTTMATEIPQAAADGDFLTIEAHATLRACFSKTLPGTDTTKVILSSARGLNVGDTVISRESGLGYPRTVNTITDSPTTTFLDRPWLRSDTVALRDFDIGGDQQTTFNLPFYPSGTIRTKAGMYFADTKQISYSYTGGSTTAFLVSKDGQRMIYADNSTSATGVHVLVRSGNDWVSEAFLNDLTSLTVSGAFAISDDGSLIIEGHGSSTTIWKRTGTTWAIFQTLPVGFSARNVVFSSDNSKFIFVNGGTGAINVYTSNGTQYTLTAQTSALGLNSRISISADFTSAVAANTYYNSSAGIVYVFNINGTVITKVATLNASAPSAYSNLGNDLLISPDKSFIMLTNAGHGLIYINPNGLWDMVVDSGTFTESSTLADGLGSTFFEFEATSDSTKVFVKAENAAWVCPRLEEFTVAAGVFTLANTIVNKDNYWDYNTHLSIDGAGTVIADDSYIYYSDISGWNQWVLLPSTNIYLSQFDVNGLPSAPVSALSVPVGLAGFDTFQIGDTMYLYGGTFSDLTNNQVTNSKIFSGPIATDGTLSAFTDTGVTLPSIPDGISSCFVQGNSLYLTTGIYIYCAPITTANSVNTIGTFSQVGVLNYNEPMLAPVVLDEVTYLFGIDNIYAGKTGTGGLLTSWTAYLNTMIDPSVAYPYGAQALSRTVAVGYKSAFIQKYVANDGPSLNNLERYDFCTGGEISNLSVTPSLNILCFTANSAVVGFDAYMQNNKVLRARAFDPAASNVAINKQVTFLETLTAVPDMIAAANSQLLAYISPTPSTPVNAAPTYTDQDCLNKTSKSVDFKNLTEVSLGYGPSTYSPPGSVVLA